EHYRLVTAKRGELDARLFVVGRKLEAWRRVTHLEPSRAGNKPELLERNHEERRAGDVPHDSAEKRGLSHHREQTREHTNVEHQDSNGDSLKYLHGRRFSVPLAHRRSSLGARTPRALLPDA